MVDDRPTRVVDYVVDAIAALGISHIFGVDGANIEDLYDAIYEAGTVTGVVAKHEFSAATMADGFARSRGDLGVVAATSGGGAMNLVSGLAESFESRVPVLALVGQPPTVLEGNGAFQDTSGKAGSIDAVALFGTISRYCARVERPADIVAHLDRAVAAAQTGGPAVLLLPKDIQQATIAPWAPFRRPMQAPVRDAVAVAAVRDTLAAGRRTGKVVILAGDQIARDNARRQLRMLTQVLDASVGVAPDAKDTYGAHEHGYCGVMGVMGNAELVDAVRHSAVCLVVGTRLPVTTRAGLDAALAATTVVSIGADTPFVPSLHAMTNDLGGTLAELASDLRGSTVAEPNRIHPSTLAVPPSSGPGLRYRDAVDVIAAALPPRADVFADAGNTGAAVVHHLPVPRGGRFVVALGMGGMGYAFGAGIGSACARRNRTFVIAGDGAFFMHGMEIHTAIELNLPVTFVVFNNNAHAMCVTREQIYYRDRYSFNRFRRSMLGEGVGAMFPTLPAFAARTVGELTDALTKSADTEGPSFISVDCDPDEIPPFAPFLSAPRS